MVVLLLELLLELELIAVAGWGAAGAAVGAAGAAAGGFDSTRAAIADVSTPTPCLVDQTRAVAGDPFNVARLDAPLPLSPLPPLPPSICRSNPPSPLEVR